MGRPDNRQKKRRPKANRAPGTALACAYFWTRYRLAEALRMEHPWDTRIERFPQSPLITGLKYRDVYAVTGKWGGGRRWRKVKRDVVLRRRESP